MQREPNDFKAFARLLAHAILATMLLAVWLSTAWLIDAFLVARFPLEGMSMIGFRFLEVVIYCSTCKAVYKLMFSGNRNNNDRWWR